MYSGRGERQNSSLQQTSPYSSPALAVDTHVSKESNKFVHEFVSIVFTPNVHTAVHMLLDALD